jgi:hypothetical protein
LVIALEMALEPSKEGAVMMRKVKATTSTPASPPSESELARLLGDAYEALEVLLARGDGAVAEWRKYTRQSPWVLKVSLGKRSLFYVRPDVGVLRVTVLLGGRAVDAALAGQVSKRLQASIRKARPYPEGRPVSVLVKSTKDLARVEDLVTVKLLATARSRTKAPARGGARSDRPAPRRSEGGEPAEVRRRRRSSR